MLSKCIWPETSSSPRMWYVSVCRRRALKTFFVVEICCARPFVCVKRWPGRLHVASRHRSPGPSPFQKTTKSVAGKTCSVTWWAHSGFHQNIGHVAVIAVNATQPLSSIVMYFAMCYWQERANARARAHTTYFNVCGVVMSVTYLLLLLLFSMFYPNCPRDDHAN